MKNDLHLRWLGVCGVELISGKHTLLIDPYLTRLKAHHLWFGRPTSNHRLIRKVIQRADHILVTHPHFDHLLDVAEIADQTGAIVHGSPNTVELLRRVGVPKNQAQLFEPASRFSFGNFQIEALPAPIHAPLGYGPGEIPSQYKLPLRAHDYRMDYMMSFLIKTSNLRLLFGITGIPAKALPVDILFLEPYAKLEKNYQDHYCEVIKDFHPRIVIPIHADDMMVPLSKPVIGQVLPQRKVFFPLRRFNFERFKQLIEGHSENTQVFLPDRLENYRLNRVLAALKPAKRSSTLSVLNPQSIKIQILNVVSRQFAFLQNLFADKA